MQEYKVDSDLFCLPYKDDHSILYAPRVGFACVVNSDAVNLLADIDNINVDTLSEEQKGTLEFLKEKGVLNNTKEYSCVQPYKEKFQPPQITLFPTNQCNLRCKYCYASAGDQKPMVMDWHYAVNAIEYMIQNQKERGSKHLSLGFHGGGEPLHPWQFIKKIVSFAEERCTKEGFTWSIYSATNGVLSEKQLEWIVKHFVNLNISFDGLPHVQDFHRPLPNGKSSFEYVDRTFKFLDKHNFNYGIRGTVSSYNIHLMPEIIHFIGQNYKSKSVHLEPLFYCGRCKTTGTLNPDMQAFADNFMACEDVAVKYGINLIYSGCHIDMLHSTFCGAPGNNFSITPDGYVATCFELTDRTDPKAEQFFIGRIEEDGSVTIDEKKRRKLYSLSVDQLEYCQDCFAKWHCAGECASKLPHADITGARGHDRCQLNRRLIANRLHRMVEKNVPTPNQNSTNPTDQKQL